MRDSKPDADIPPGWNYNPATWGQRMPIIVAAVIGFFIAGYLTLYQWDVIQTVWEPFFGDGSITILNSHVSEIFPYPFTDAFLGALGYLADAVAGAVGGKSRWRTMPWIVILFGIFIGPLGAVSIVLVILQPVLLDAWCTLCLATAFISVVMIGPALDEVLASLQHIKRSRGLGRSTWRVFWGLDERKTDRESVAADGRAQRDTDEEEPGLARS